MTGVDELWVGIAGVLLLVALVALGVRVYVAAALTGFLGLLWLKGWTVAASIAGTIPHSKTVTYPLSVLPLFILIGFLAFHAGLTTRLFEVARRWVGWVPGGLAVSTVFASAGFAAVSGASKATSSSTPAMPTHSSSTPVMAKPASVLRSTRSLPALASLRGRFAFWRLSRVRTR